MSARFDLSERLSWPFFGPEHRIAAELVTNWSAEHLLGHTHGELRAEVDAQARKLVAALGKHLAQAEVIFEYRSSDALLPASTVSIISLAVNAPSTKISIMQLIQLNNERGLPPLPPAYHTNRGNIGAGWLVKSERP